MTVVTATRPGSADRENEDWVGSAAGVVVVLDGVSAPGGSPCEHGPAWYVRQLGPALLEAAADRGRDVRSALAEAICEVAGCHPECDRDSPGTPAAAVGILRSEGERVSYLVLADVTLVLANAASEMHVVTDDRVEHALDPQLRAAALSLPLGRTEQRKAVRAMSIDQLARRNTPGGYWVAASDPVAADEAVVASVPRAHLHEALLMTDGVSPLVTAYGMTSWEQLMDMARSHGPDAVIERVRDVETGDPAGDRWPRFKVSDDAALAHVPVAELP